MNLDSYFITLIQNGLIRTNALKFFDLAWGYSFFAKAQRTLKNIIKKVEKKNPQHGGKNGKSYV